VPFFGGFKDRRQHVPIDPFDDRYAHRVAKAEQALDCVLGQHVVAGALQPCVFLGRHPAHTKLAAVDCQHDLLRASAARRAQAARHAVEPDLHTLAALSHAAECG
jgi:hypothetical protein